MYYLIRCTKIRKFWGSIEIKLEWIFQVELIDTSKCMNQNKKVDYYIWDQIDAWTSNELVWLIITYTWEKTPFLFLYSILCNFFVEATIKWKFSLYSQMGVMKMSYYETHHFVGFIIFCLLIWNFSRQKHSLKKPSNDISSSSIIGDFLLGH